VVQITLHGWLGKYGDMGGGAGGGLSVGVGSDVVEGAEAEGEGDAGYVGDDGDEEADASELLVSSSKDDNPSSCIILIF
jgi:hypothetical protein